MRSPPGSAQVALVIASDARRPGPGTGFEAAFAAPARRRSCSRRPAARDGLGARVTRSRPFLDRYRGDGEDNVRDLYDARLFREEIFLPVVAEVASRARVVRRAGVVASRSRRPPRCDRRQARRRRRARVDRRLRGSGRHRRGRAVARRDRRTRRARDRRARRHRAAAARPVSSSTSTRRSPAPRS